jgi:hypothetical protein
MHLMARGGNVAERQHFSSNESARVMVVVRVRSILTIGLSLLNSSAAGRWPWKKSP